MILRIQWIPAIVNVSGATIGVSYNRNSLYAGVRGIQIGSRGEDTH